MPDSRLDSLAELFSSQRTAGHLGLPYQNRVWAGVPRMRFLAKWKFETLLA